MDIVAAIYQIARDLFAMQGQFRERDEKRRSEIAAYFRDISDCLDRVHNSLATNRYPHGACQELVVHADNMVSVIGDYIGETEAQSFAETLREAHNVERLYDEFGSDPAARIDKLPKIDEAAGFFRGLSSAVSASPV